MNTNPASGIIKDSSIETFQADVLEESQRRPVLVDFWADWCGPCKQLTPALEEAVTEAGGAVALVKIDADKNKTLMSQLQVQSLPTVIIFYGGRPIDGFQGAVPKSQLKMMIDRLIEAVGAQAPGDEDPVAGAMEEVKALREAGDDASARMLLGRVLEVAPETVSAHLMMLEYTLKDGDLAALKEGLEAIDETALEDDGDKGLYKRLSTALLLAGEGDPGADTAALEAKIAADPQDHQSRFDLALTHQARGDLPAAAEALLASIMRDKDWEEGKARAQLLKLFEAAGNADPFTLKYRRRLSSVLFS